MSLVPVSPSIAAPSFGRFLSIRQAAALLGVCPKTLRREVVRGKFPRPARIGRAVRISLADVEAYAASLRA